MVHAGTSPRLPVFDGWIGEGSLSMALSGLTERPFGAMLSLGGVTSARREAVLGDEEGSVFPFSLAFEVPLGALRAVLGAPLVVELLVSDAPLRLCRATLVPVPGEGPRFASFDLLDVTDALLYGAAPRHRFELTNPEEGFWAGTGRHRLEVRFDWADEPGQPPGSATGAPHSARGLLAWMRGLGPSPDSATTPLGADGTGPERAHAPDGARWVIERRPSVVRVAHPDRKSVV